MGESRDGTKLSSSLRADARAVYETVSRGGLVLLPTDVGYGLIGMKPQALHRIYELKGRPLSKPCVTVVNGAIFDDLTLPLASEIREWIEEVTRRTPIAVVARLDDRSRLLGAMPREVRAQTTQNGTIATFHSAGRLVEAVAVLAEADGRLLFGSSANLAGTGHNATFEDVPESMRGGVDLAIDRGPVWYENEHQHATTILDLRTGTFLRKGINFEQIERSWSALRKAA